MGLVRNGRVNMVITNHVLRYSYHKRATLESLVDKGEVELPPGTIRDGVIENRELLTRVLTKLMKKKRWKKKNLFFCLPDDSVVIRELTIPNSLTRDEAKNYLQNQLGNTFHLPFANPAITIEFLEEKEQEREILLYAYPKDKIAAFEEVFREVGFKPLAADLTSLSVYRYYFTRYRQENEHVLHIQWNWNALIVTVFHNHKAIFTRYLKLELDGYPYDLSKKEVDEVILQNSIEVNRLIDFYQFSISKGQANISLVLLSGDFPYINEVKNNLRESLTPEVFTFSDSEDELKYMDVFGLALKQEA